MGKTLMEAIEKGRNAPPPDGIEPEKARRKREPSQAAIDLLKTLLRLRAEQSHVAPRLIANADDIESIAAFEDGGIAALQGWRAEVFGNDALALRKGELGIALSNGKAVVVKLGAEKA
jgi:ribonuclease D